MNAASAVYHLAMHRRTAQWPGSYADSRVRHFLYQVLLLSGASLCGQSAAKLLI